MRPNKKAGRHFHGQKIICGLLSAVFLASSVLAMPAYAADTSSLEQQKAELQKKIDDANAKINELNSDNAGKQSYITALSEKMDLVQQQIDVLDSQVKEIQGKIDALEAQIKEKQDLITDLEVQIAEQKKLFSVKKEQYEQRLRVLYISGSVTNLEVLLNSEDTATFLTRAQLINDVSKKDQAALTELSDAMKEIKEKQTELESSKQTLEAGKVELLTSRSSRDDALSAVEKQKQALQADRAQNQKMIEANQLEMIRQGNIKKDSQADQDQVAQDIKDAEANLGLGDNNGNQGSGNQGGGSDPSDGGSQGGGTTEPPTTGGGSGSGSGENPGGGSSGEFDYSFIGTGKYKGRFVHPVPGRKEISVGFPNYADGDWHGGVDFACWSYFPPIYAADTGVVLIAKDLGSTSYGKYIVIRHESGLYTLYGHCSELYVSVGQTVNRGQQIAQVGSTGNSSGNHLHFEVRLGQAESNRNVANPSWYIKDTLFWF